MKSRGVSISYEADGVFGMFSQLCGGRRHDSCQGQEGEDERQAGEQESNEFGGESAGASAADQEPEPAGPAQVREPSLWGGEPEQLRVYVTLMVYTTLLTVRKRVNN